MRPRTEARRGNPLALSLTRALQTLEGVFAQRAIVADLPGLQRCVFRKSVTARFGIVTDEFGNVTGDFGDVTEGRQTVA